MGKVTFVVDFPEGQEPTVSAAIDILGGKLDGVYFGDMREQWAWRSVEQEPRHSEQLLVQYEDGILEAVNYSEHDGWLSEDVKFWMPLPEAMEVDDE